MSKRMPIEWSKLFSREIIQLEKDLNAEENINVQIEIEFNLVWRENRHIYKWMDESPFFLLTMRNTTVSISSSLRS